MINRIKALFEHPAGNQGAGGGEEDAVRLAAAALLVESASLDGNFDDAERTRITELLTSRFGLDPQECETLIAEAEKAIDNSGQLYAFTRVIKDNFTEDQRVFMIEMLWEVAYADGRVDHFESNLIRRVGGLIFVSDRARGEARKRVTARLGIAGSAV